MQKIIRFLAVTLCTFLTFLPFASFAQNSYEIIIVNKFDKKLNFKATINPHIVPNLPTSIASGGQATVTVLDPGTLNGKEAYIYVDIDDNKNQTDKNKMVKAYWGVEIEQGKIQLHGYIGRNINYYWKKGGNVVTFYNQTTSQPGN